MRTIATFVFALAAFQLSAQLVSTSTNAIRLDFGQTQSEEEITLPSIAWEFPSREYTNSEERKATFIANMKSTKPIKEVTMAVSRQRGEKPLATKTFEVPDNAFEFRLEKEMNLLDGENVISVSVTNEDGGTVTDYRNVLVGLDALSKAIDINRQDYALLIGTDKYDHWSDLVNPIYDVETVSELLGENYGFETETLLNPVQEDVLIKIKEYSQKKYRPQDQLLIFVAGHGQFDEAFGEGYIVTKNSLANDEAKTSYIAHSVLRNIIDNIPCDHILLVMDVCFSGTFDPVIARSRAAIYEDVDDSELLVRKLSKKTRRYLTSGGKEYVSDGVPGQHSPFAQKFIEVLKSRGGNDRIITLQEIFPVMQRLQTLPRTGEFGSNEQDSDFVFVVK